MVLLGGLGAALAHLLIGGLIGAAAFVSVTLAALYTTRTRPAREGVRDLRPWHRLGWGALLFGAAAYSRPLLAGQGPVAALVPDLAFALPGYLFFLTGLVALARTALARRELPWLRLDLILALAGTATATLAIFAVPAANAPGTNPALALLAATFPVLDIACLSALTVLALSSATRLPAAGMLIGAFVVFTVADLGYAALASKAADDAPRVLDALFLVALTLLAAAAAHPSVRGFNDVRAESVPAWTPLRVSLIAVVSALPGAAMVLTPQPGNPAVRAVLALGTVGIVAALIRRALGAVNAYARSEAALVRSAETDELTGLDSRTRLERNLRRALSDTAPEHTVSVLVLALDGVRFVNDAYGHAVGDRLLSAAGNRLRELAEDSGATASRLAGERFVLVTTDTPDGAHGAALAEEAGAAFETPLRLSIGPVDATVTIGWVCSNQVSEPTPVALLGAADAAFDEARATGRGSVVRYDEQLRAEVRERVEMESALRRAVAEQVQLDLDPVIGLAATNAVGVVIDARWEHPKAGLVPAAAFWSMAEEYGLAVRVSEQLIVSALHESAQGEHASVCVGVHAGQLSTRLLQTLREHGQEHPGSLERLVLEVPESVAATAGAATATLTAAQKLGVRISISEFGSSSGTLEALRLLDPDTVVLPASLVARIGRGDRTEEVVRSVVAAAHATGAAVGAAGVDSAEQVEALRGLGVRFARGPLYRSARTSRAR